MLLTRSTVYHRRCQHSTFDHRTPNTYMQIYTNARIAMISMLDQLLNNLHYGPSSKGQSSNLEQDALRDGRFRPGAATWRT